MSKFLKKFYPILFLVIGALCPLFIKSTYILVVLNQCVAFSICAIGVYIVLGLTGQMSQAQAAFFAIGAYGSAYFSMKMGIPVVFSMLIGILLAGLAGLAIGIPTLKLSGRYLTITTLGFTIIVKLTLDNWKSVSNGTDGIRSIPVFSLFGFQFATKQLMFYFALAMLVVAVVIVRRLRDGEFGMGLMMVRDNEEAAQACGINVAFYKTAAYVLGGMLCGLGGCVYAHTIQYIQPSDFSTAMSQNVLIMLVLGGYRYLPGAIIGAFIVTLLPEVLRFMSDYRMLFFGVLVCVVIAFAPGGISQAIADLGERIGLKAEKRKEAGADGNS